MSNLVSFNTQSGIFNPDDFEHKRITIIGAGAIGSFTALTLAKMGISDISVYDFDVITPHNIPNQFYKVNQVGSSKTLALAEIIDEFSETNIRSINKKFTRMTKVTGGIVISLVDNMDTRKLIFNKCVRAKIPFIDARMGGEFMRVYAVTNAKDIKRYKDTLHTDGESEELRCTERSIIYNPLIASGFISILVKKILKKEPHPFEILGDLKTLNFTVQ